MTFDLWGAITRFLTMPGVQAIVLILTAIGTVGSVITALAISTKAERRQDTRDRIEARATLERRADRQAVLVKVREAGTMEGANTGGQKVYQARVSNYSDHPIFDVRLALEIADGDGKRLHWSETPKWEVPPRDVREAAPYSADRLAEVHVLGVRAIFLDAYGDTWSLDSEGTLELTKAREIR